MKNNSIEAWRQYWKEVDHQIQVADRKGELHDAYEWIHGRKIVVYSMPDIFMPKAIRICEGIDDLLRTVGLDFKLDLNGSPYLELEKNPHLNDQVSLEMQYCTRKDGSLDIDEFEQFLLDYHDGGHGEVFIVDQPLSGKRKSVSYFSRGYAIFNVSGIEDHSTLSRIGKHEASHLFGYPHCHEDEPVRGYVEAKECNMMRDLPTLETCNRCSDAMVSFWRGIERRTDERFFRYGKWI